MLTIRVSQGRSPAPDVIRLPPPASASLGQPAPLPTRDPQTRIAGKTLVRSSRGAKTAAPELFGGPRDCP